MTANTPAPKLSSALQREIETELTVTTKDKRNIISYRCKQVRLMGFLAIASEVGPIGFFTFVRGTDDLFILGPLWGIAAFSTILILSMMLTPVRVFIERGRLTVVRKVLGKSVKTKVRLSELKFELSPVRPNSPLHTLQATDGVAKVSVCNPSRNLEMLRAMPAFYRETFSLGRGELVELNAASEPSDYQNAA